MQSVIFGYWCSFSIAVLGEFAQRSFICPYLSSYCFIFNVVNWHILECALTFWPSSYVFYQILDGELGGRVWKYNDRAWQHCDMICSSCFPQYCWIRQLGDIVTDLLSLDSRYSKGSIDITSNRISLSNMLDSSAV